VVEKYVYFVEVFVAKDVKYAQKKMRKKGRNKNFLN